MRRTAFDDQSETNAINARRQEFEVELVFIKHTMIMASLWNTGYRDISGIRPSYEYTVRAKPGFQLFKALFVDSFRGPSRTKTSSNSPMHDHVLYSQY